MPAAQRAPMAEDVGAPRRAAAPSRRRRSGRRRAAPRASPAAARRRASRRSRGARPARQRHDALDAALAEHAHVAREEIDVAHVRARALADAQPGP
jgi:hypothetical protein